MNEITEKMEAMHPGITTKGDRLVVGVSGGKDSGALCLMLKDHGFGPDDYDRVFCDTGWELPEVYDYLRGPLTDAVGPITELRPEIALSPRLEEIAAQLEERMGHHSGRRADKCDRDSSRRKRGAIDGDSLGLVRAARLLDVAPHFAMDVARCDRDSPAPQPIARAALFGWSKARRLRPLHYGAQVGDRVAC